MKRLLKEKLRRFSSLLIQSDTKRPINYRVGANCEIDVSCSFGTNNSIGRFGYLYNVHLGDFTYIGQNVTIMNTEIGKFCSIAQGVCIGLGDHPSSKFVSTHPAFFSPNKQCGYSFTNQRHFPEMGKNTIGHDVWIGVNAIIMNNVIIGNGAIIGAGAVVTKNVPPYAIVVGSPAKIIKYRFEENEIKTLLELEWWNWDYEWLEQNYKSFFNMADFLNRIYSDNELQKSP